MRCSGYWPDRPLGPDGAQLIMAYDWEKGTIEQIVEEPLPTDTWVPSWNPEMTRDVMSYGGLLGTITWITPTGMEPMTITIGTGEQPWSLAENLVVMEDYRHGNDRTTEVGIARNPAWSPDGRYIAFWASTNVIGRSGMSRARGTYSLYLLDPDTLQLQQILENVQNMTLLVWSPDSQWLSFTGDIGVSKDSLWLTSVDGSILQLIDKGGNVDSSPDFNGWNWLNNQEIIATRCLDANCDQAEVVKYDVSEIVNSAQ
ncbi:MAG: PD40 domain-containing protein [Anaerolineae bacterium]|nr:PD40 domain-containing protein [Anaerolineae bacterium]